jgi:ribosomal protein S14
MSRCSDQEIEDGNGASGAARPHARGGLPAAGVARGAGHRRCARFGWDVHARRLLFLSRNQLREATPRIIRVRVGIMGSQTCRIVGKSQPVLIMINPIIFTRTRNTPPGRPQDSTSSPSPSWRRRSTATRRARWPPSTPPRTVASPYRTSSTSWTSWTST